MNQSLFVIIAQFLSIDDINNIHAISKESRKLMNPIALQMNQIDTKCDTKNESQMNKTSLNVFSSLVNQGCEESYLQLESRTDFFMTRYPRIHVPAQQLSDWLCCGNYEYVDSNISELDH